MSNRVRVLVLSTIAAMALACPDEEPVASADAQLRDAASPTDTGEAVDTDANLVDDASTAQDASADASDADLGSADADGEDASADAGLPPDLGPPDTGAPMDSGPPADSGAPFDGGASDAGICPETLLDSVIVDCSGAYAYARIFGTRPMQAGCPDFVRLLGTRYPDISSALTGENCNTNCIWQAFQSVSFIDHCNRRNGYIVFRTRSSGSCPDLYEFSNGIFLSVAAWTMATPCP